MQNYKITQCTNVYNNTNNKRSINWCKLFGMNMQRMSKNSSNVLKCLYNFKLRNAASESRSVSLQWWRQSCSRVCTVTVLLRCSAATFQRAEVWTVAGEWGHEGWRWLCPCIWQWIGVPYGCKLHLICNCPDCPTWCRAFFSPTMKSGCSPPHSRRMSWGHLCSGLMDLPNESCGVVPGDGIGEMYR